MEGKASSDSSLAPQADLNIGVQIVVRAHERLWNAAGIAFKIELADHLPLAPIEPHQLEQALSLLIANAEDAIGASPSRSGQIQIRTSIQGQRLQITISDNGCGIPSREMPYLFDNKGLETRLTTCAEIVRDRGGELYAWSNYGNGSAFTIEFPVQPVGHPHNSRSSQRGLQGKRILVIDDEAQIAALMFDVLKRQGAQIDLANSGTQAVEQIKAKQYDLLICDQWMPDLTGEGLYRCIESMNPALRDRFLFVTGDVLSEGIDEFLTQSGVQYIRKPFRMVELVAAAEEVVNRNLRFDS